MGGRGLEERKRAYYNSLDDADHLIAVTASANRSKGARGPGGMATDRRILLVRIRPGLDQDQAGVGPERDLSRGGGARRDAGQVRNADASGGQSRLIREPACTEHRCGPCRQRSDEFSGRPTTDQTHRAQRCSSVGPLRTTQCPGRFSHYRACLCEAMRRFIQAAVTSTFRLRPTARSAFWT